MPFSTNYSLRTEQLYQFRSMWTEFEWENRVNVTTSVTYADRPCSSRPPCEAEVFCREPREYLSHVMKVTNMSCLTPEGALSGDCDFLSANMYARSLFGMCSPATVFEVSLQPSVIGEDALANLSIEKTEAGNITGHVRIRSKTQGIALSLGDRITTSQKDGKPPI